MSLTTQQLEGIIWPKYREPVEALAQASWDIARAANVKLQSMTSPPKWFTEALEVQVKSLLNVIFSIEQSWVVLSEPISGFTIVMYKTPRGAIIPIQQSKLQLVHHTQSQFSEISQLVEKTLIKIIKGYMKANGNVIELENEDGVIYVFPKAKAEEYLGQLGFPKSSIPQIMNANPVPSDFLKQ